MKNILSNVCVLCTAIMTCFCLTGCPGPGDNEDEPKIPEPQAKVDSLIFTFTLSCSEDFLDYVTPVATYIDENNAEQKIEVSKSAFILSSNNDGLVDKSQSVLYSWEKEIKLANTLTGQRDMQVAYQKKADAPAIDNEKIYIMYHKLSHGYSVKPKEGGSTTHIDNSVVVIDGQDVNRKDVKGENLPQYLDNLEENPDYDKAVK